MLGNLTSGLPREAANRLFTANDRYFGRLLRLAGLAA
jgi:hypothetical protein